MNFDAQGERQFDLGEVTPLRVLNLAGLDTRGVTDIAEQLTEDVRPDFLPLSMDEIARGVELLIFRWGDPVLPATIKAINAVDHQESNNSPNFAAVTRIRGKIFEVEFHPRLDAYQHFDKSSKVALQPGYQIADPHLLAWDEKSAFIDISYFEHSPEVKTQPTYFGVLPEYYAILTRKF